MAELRQIKPSVQQRRAPAQMRASLYALLLGLSVFAGAAVAQGNTTQARPTDSVSLVVEQALAGEFALQSGRLQEAAQRYAQAAVLSRQTSLVDRAATIALYAKDYESAETVAQRWLELDPAAPGALRTQAWLALASGRAELADQSLRALLAPATLESQRATAQVLIAAENRDLAPGVMRQLAEDGLLVALERGPVWSAIASNLGEFELAVNLAAAETRLRPQDAESWRRLAQAQLAAKRNADAARTLERALALDPENFELRLALAGLHAHAGDAVKADRLLERAPDQSERSYSARIAFAAQKPERKILTRIARQLRRVQTKDVPSRAFLSGQVAELLEDADAALKWYQQEPEGPAFHDASLRRAVLLARERGELGAARELLASLRDDAQSHSEKVDAYLLEAELVGETDRSGVRAIYDEALAQLPNDQRLLYSRALLRAADDDIDGLEDDLRKILSMDPDNAQALNALGYTLADRTDRHGEALGYIEKALAQQPEDGAFIDSMGWVQFRLGNLTEALRYLRRAYELMPDPEVAAHLAEVLWVSEERDEAQRLWREALAKWPEHSVLLESIQRLAPGFRP